MITAIFVIVEVFILLKNSLYYYYYYYIPQIPKSAKIDKENDKNWLSIPATTGVCDQVAFTIFVR